MCSLNSMPSLVQLHICQFLTGSDIINMSMLDKAWYNIISVNRHTLPKKRVILKMDLAQGKQGSKCQFKLAKLVVEIEQKGHRCFYGVQLQDFTKMDFDDVELYAVDFFDPLDLSEGEDFDVTNLSALRMEHEFDEVPTKSTDDIDSAIEQLFSVITSKVDIEELILEATNINDTMLRFFSKCSGDYETRVRSITLNIHVGRPRNSVGFLDSISACEDVTIIFEDGSALPIGILETKAVRQSQFIHIETSPKPSVNQETEENHDEQIASLSAERILIIGTCLTAHGANLLTTVSRSLYLIVSPLENPINFQQWQSGQRNISRRGIEISILFSEFDGDSVFEGVHDYERIPGPGSHNHFLVGRISNGKRQTVNVSWDDEYFVINGLKDDQ